MPLAAGWAARRARELADAIRTPSGNDGGPIPPRRLRARTGVPGAQEFAHGGRVAALELSGALAGAGIELEPIQSILDFGCGSGRVLPHMSDLSPAASCAGCDVDAAAITWAARHLRSYDWLLCGSQPPLPFAAGSFELIYSISVLSHLDELGQDRWLSELRRVLVPGGIALLTVHGPHAFEQFRDGQVRSRWCRLEAFVRPSLDPGEFVFEPYLRSRFNASDLPGVGTNYGLAFHEPGYIRERWSRTFEVLAVRPRAVTGWQDAVVLRARPGAGVG